MSRQKAKGRRQESGGEDQIIAPLRGRVLLFTIHHLRFTAFDLFTIYHLRFTSARRFPACNFLRLTSRHLLLAVG
jgi:hypothetical protein